MGRWIALAVALGACGDQLAAPDAGADAPVDDDWAIFTIPAGAHDAELSGGHYRDPIVGVTTAAARVYDLAFDPSASYVLTDPVQPGDQLDWNKLPGLSDCGGPDLSADGAMFGWRWRVDLGVLEVTAYANDGGVHLTAPEPLLVLDAGALAARAPIRFELVRDADVYRFTAGGVHATLPRRCTDQPVDVAAYAGELYFGGTSVAPQQITAAMREY